MSRLVAAWDAMSREQRIAGAAALALLATMFLPWYSLQSLDRRTGVIYSHDISAFGDVSFVEAAIFLVATGVMAMTFLRAEGREFQLPGGDGTIVTIAGAWATLLIFYRVFSRPSGDGYPVGIQWGFFLAFVAAGSLAYAGWRMRHDERPEPPARRRPSRAPVAPEQPPPAAPPDDEPFARAAPATVAASRARPIPAEPPVREPPTGDTTLLIRASRRRDRPRYPPAPPEQLSFEDQPSHGE